MLPQVATKQKSLLCWSKYLIWSYKNSCHHHCCKRIQAMVMDLRWHIHLKNLQRKHTSKGTQNCWLRSGEGAFAEVGKHFFQNFTMTVKISYYFNNNLFSQSYFHRNNAFKKALFPLKAMMYLLIPFITLSLDFLQANPSPQDPR